QPPDAAGSLRTRLRPPYPVAVPRVSHHGLARAGNLRLLRHPVRRSSLVDPDHDARRLARAPPAQGLPARRNPGRVQGRAYPAARRAEGIQLMNDIDT